MFLINVGVITIYFVVFVYKITSDFAFESNDNIYIDKAFVLICFIFFYDLGFTFFEESLKILGVTFLKPQYFLLISHQIFEVIIYQNLAFCLICVLGLIKILGDTFLKPQYFLLLRHQIFEVIIYQNLAFCLICVLCLISDGI